MLYLCDTFLKKMIYASYSNSRGLAERGQEEEQENEQHQGTPFVLVT